MQIPALQELTALIAITTEPLYLVGGSVRDLLLGDENIRDIDLLMPFGSEDVARRFADKIGGAFFFLDVERKITRVVLRSRAGGYQFDFTNFDGAGLDEDLGRRDFTVNAMALDLRRFLASRSLDDVIDRFGGREDVRQKRIRAADPRVFDNDPLRLLRAVRFAATLGFSLDDRTAVEIRKRREQLAAPSRERVRDEFFRILDRPGAERHLVMLDNLGLLDVLLPELAPLRDFRPGKHHRYDIFTHSLKAADYVDSVLGEIETLAPRHGAAIREHLDEWLEQTVSRMAALRFACVLHDIAKAETYSVDPGGDVHFFGHDQQGADLVKEICSRFRLSRKTVAVVEKLVRHHMRPLGLSVPSGPSKRALYRYCRDLTDALPESIILSLSDAKATAEVMPAEGFTDTRHTAGVILEFYYGRFLKTEAKPLVTVQDLIDRGMRPGPRFREILQDVRERQSEGILRDRNEALAYIAGIH